MKKILITGASSGLGYALTKRLTGEGYTVWGIARRKSLLQQLQRSCAPKKFIFSNFDLTKEDSWKQLLHKLKEKKFIPDIVIFNAAINPVDIENEIRIDITRNIFETNFFSVIKGVNHLLPYLKHKGHFIAISSSSAIKGNASEGIGYSSSKAALSLAFEALYQKFLNSKIRFTTIYFGPINTGMRRFQKIIPFTLSENDAVNCIIKAINGKEGFYYCPNLTLLPIRILKIISTNLILRIFNTIEHRYNK